MLLYGVEHTHEPIDVLHGSVDTDMEPRVTLDGHVYRYAPQGKHLLPAQLLQHLTVLPQVARHTAQRAWLVVHQSVDNFIILLKCEVCHLSLYPGDMLAQQVPNDFGVAASHHQPVGVIAVGSRAFLLECLIGAHEHEYDKSYERKLDKNTAKSHGKCHNTTNSKCHTGRDEPSANDGYHSRNTEHGALTAPGMVGKAGTHGNHECDVGRRQRQLVVCTDGDKH